MRLPDPLGLKNKPNKFTIFSAFVAELGERSRQEDVYAKEKEECFALADGVGGMPHGDVAAHLAVESAIWTYTLTKRKPYYWHDKKLFAGRMFRSANWRVYNKRRDPGFEDGLATTLLVVIISERKFYIYNVGDCSAYLFRDNKVVRLTVQDRAENGAITKALGIVHDSPVPSYGSYDMFSGDIIIVATDGFADWVSEAEIQAVLSEGTTTQENLNQKAQHLISEAARHGSTDNRSIGLIAIC